MDFQLNITHIFHRMRTIYGTSEIIARGNSGIERFTYQQFTDLILRTAGYLRSIGIRPGDVVASLSWNTRHHLQLYFAVPLIGAVLNTVNIKYSEETIRWMIKQNGAKVLFYEDLPSVFPEGDDIIEISMDRDLDRKIEAMGTSVQIEDPEEEEAAIVCYTSGTTGDPKGVVYTHRSIVIHSLSLLGSDVLALSRSDNILVVVPMYHISGWDVPFAAGLTGANLVLPGTHPSPEDLLDIIRAARVNKAVAAPTVWTSLLERLESGGESFGPLKYAGIGGAEPSDYIIRKLAEYGIEAWHLWGMTETESIASISKPGINDIHHQGIAVPGFELMVINGDKRPVKWDGRSTGELIVRGAFATGTYYLRDKESTDRIIEIDGKDWLRTGDIVRIFPNGSFKIVDRDKDLIKSGGEWISSIDLENAIMEHPEVLEAAVIGRRDLKWGERPVAVIVPRERFRNNIQKESIINYLRSLNRFPRWWLPSDIYFTSEIPKTGTGKFDKKALRQLYASLLDST